MAGAGRVGGWLAAALVVLAAVAYQLSVPPAPDVAWLMTMAGAILDGAEPYRDIADPNPPMSALLYVPVVLLDRTLDLGPRAAIAAAVVLLFTATMALTAWLTRGRADPPDALLWPAAALVLVLMPSSEFAQREHAAVLLVLPIVAAAALRRDGLRPGLPAIVACGLAAGLAATIKPHFALAVALPFVGAAVARRDVRALVAPEALIAAAVLIGYGTWVLIAVPVYASQWVPLLLDTYRAVSVPVADLVATPVVAGAGLATAAALWLSRGRGFALSSALAALGFLIAAVEQAKGWGNHAYPAVALALLSLTASAVAAAPRTRMLAFAASLAALSLALPALTLREPDTTAFAPVIRAEAPPNPRILLISGAVAAGHPLALEVDGRWVGHTIGQWAAAFALHRLEGEALDAPTRQRLEAIVDAERRALAADFARGDPDVLLIDRATGDWLAFAREDPAVAARLAGYERRAEASGVELWLRAGG